MKVIKNVTKKTITDNSEKGLCTHNLFIYT